MIFSVIEFVMYYYRINCVYISLYAEVQKLSQKPKVSHLSG